MRGTVAVARDIRGAPLALDVVVLLVIRDGFTIVQRLVSILVYLREMNKDIW